MQRYARTVVRHPWAIGAVILAVTSALSWSATRLHVEVDPDRLLPQEHPFMKTANEVKRIFGIYNLVVIGLFPKDGNVYTPQFLAKLDEITERVAGIPGVKPALLQSLAAPEVKVVRGTADTLEVERVMQSPPADAIGADAVRLRALSENAYVGTLVSEDGKAAAVLADFELTPEMPGYINLDEAVRSRLRDAEDGTFEWGLSGAVVMLSQVSQYSGRMVYYFPIALLLIGLIHYHAFRTVQALVLPLVTALLSVLWSVGLMGVFGVPLDPYNATTPILILAVAAGHAVQILKRFYEEYDHVPDVREAVVTSLVKVGPVMVAACVVAALSFFSLATFKTASIRTFGLFTGFGILSALVIELTIIPAVRVLLPAPKRRELEREASSHPWLDAVLRFSARSASGPQRRRIFAGALVLAIACVALASRIEVDTSLKRQFGPSETVSQEDRRVNEAFAGTNTLELLITADEEGGLEEPAILRAIDGLSRELEREPAVGKGISYVDFVRTLYRALSAGDADAGDFPKSRDVTAQTLFLYSVSGGDKSLDTYLDPTHRHAVLRFLVHDDSTRYGQQLIARSREIIARTFPPGYQVRYTGTIASAAANTEVMVEGKLQNILQITLITFGVSALLLRSALGGLLVVTPLALAVLVTFGAMGFFGIPLDGLTSAIAAMAVGIGADYAMYFLFRVREEVQGGVPLEVALGRALMTSGKAVFFVASAIAVGYATLCLSSFGLHVKLGGLVALAMLVSAVSAVVLLPALVSAGRPAFLVTTRPVGLVADANPQAA
jgi:predicted RND superfamily exporter protein